MARKNLVYKTNREEMAAITYQELQETVYNIAKTVNDVLYPVAKAIAKCTIEMYDVMYTAYIEDGAKHGKTHKGFMRWLEENNHD